MSSLYITHYYVKGTDPWKNIMLLPEKAAFQKAAELASAHKGMTSYGRFADFINYYPLRKAADKLLREQFTGRRMAKPARGFHLTKKEESR